MNTQLSFHSLSAFLPRIRRRWLWGALLPFACTAALAQSVTLKIVDVGGAFNLLQGAIESYRIKHPEVAFSFVKALAPELPGALQAAQTAGKQDVDLVLGGGDILAAGIEQNLWVRLLPEHSAKFPNVMDNYFKESRKMQELAGNQGLAVVYALGGPLLEYNPDKVAQAPTTPEELLTWCRAHPGRFTYARPANSGPGRAFLMGLPYLLGDRDPKDPVEGCTQTWAFLKALNKCIDSYPPTTGGLMKDLGSGARDMTVSTTGWDINPRALGVVPKQFRIGAFKNMTWINDTQYMMVPKGLSADRLNVVLDVMAHLLKREQQAQTYDKGYFYPGPAVKNVPFSLAPPESQKVIKEFGRVEYTMWGLTQPHAQPLSAQAMVKAFKIWDDEVGKRP